MSAGKIIILVVGLYCAVTIAPFYVLFVRAFTPTVNSSAIHFWPPDRPEINMNARIGNLASVNNIDLQDFKKEFGLQNEYLDPRLTLAQIAAKYSISEADTEAYLYYAIRYNGIYTIIQSGFLHSLFGTLLVTVGSVLLGGFLGILTGTGLAGLNTRWKLQVYNLYLLNLIVPPLMVIIPQFLMLSRYAGLQDSYLAIILLNIKGGALSTMVFTSYISTIPKELRESVFMDGGGYFQYFRHVVLPLTGTPFAVYASIMLPLFWNDLLHGILFLKPENYTLPAFVASVGGAYGRNYEAVYSGLLMSLLPMLAVYLAFQKLFVRSAMAGAVKG